LELIGGLWNGFWHLLLNFLIAINSVVGNAGVSIIIFTIFMRLLTVPFTLKALRSSRNMQAVQPLVKQVQRDYPKDRAKQQEETMKIYRDYGINPASGCFPMLLQLPIFFGLFSALSFVLPMGSGNVTADAQWALNQVQLGSFIWNTDWIGVGHASDFRQPFLWVTNLGAPDPLFIWPALSSIFQFIQTRMSIPRRDPNNPGDPQQRMMQNLMQFMPIMIFFVSYGFPAGTVIYWAFSALFGAVLQYFITGFGTLPDLPGLGRLPRKEVPVPAAIDAAILQARAAKRKNSVFGRMMDRALEAQEAQRNAQSVTEVTSDGAKTVPIAGSTKTRPTKPGKASTPVAQTTTRPTPPSSKAQAKARSIVSKSIESGNGVATGSTTSGNVYASDARKASEGNGVATPTNLPKKSKGKK
jgi:YidC/Oxa1 family membrane protein insertase